MSLIRKHGAVLQAWACLDLVMIYNGPVISAVRLKTTVSGATVVNIWQTTDWLRSELHYFNLLQNQQAVGYSIWYLGILIILGICYRPEIWYKLTLCPTTSSSSSSSSLSLFAQRTQRNKNSELKQRMSGRTTWQQKSYTDSCPWKKIKYTQNYTKLDKTIELTLDITKI